MTRQQKRIIIVLAAANTLFLAVLLVVLMTFARPASPLGLPTPVPTYEAPARLTPGCRRHAVELLSAAGATGQAALADQALQFELVHRVTETRPASYAPQHVWTAFDVALGLADAGCQGFRRIEAVVETQGGDQPYRVRATADMVDLRAYRAGELSESALIDHVQYRVERLDNDPL
jgi:hypothetical protein